MRIIILFFLVFFSTNSFSQKRLRKFNHTDSAKISINGIKEKRAKYIYTIEHVDGKVIVWRHVKSGTGWRPQMVGLPMDKKTGKGVKVNWVTEALKYKY